MKDYSELELTKEQLKAAKEVYSVIKKAGSFGVHFWDDYGTLSCYNGYKIKSLSMDFESHSNIEIHEHRLAYYEQLKNFHAGNADDNVYVNL
jgi:hypothetical protein